MKKSNELSGLAKNDPRQVKKKERGEKKKNRNRALIKWSWNSWNKSGRQQKERKHAGSTPRTKEVQKLNSNRWCVGNMRGKTDKLTTERGETQLLNPQGLMIRDRWNRLRQSQKEGKRRTGNKAWQGETCKKTKQNRKGLKQNQKPLQ